jgi:hypothetical protein
MATKAKFGMLPGDVPKRIKIKMMERNEGVVSPMGHITTVKEVKVWRRIIRDKAKVKLKLRASRELKTEIDDLQEDKTDGN